MSTSKPRNINGLLLFVAVAGLLFGSAGPAAASHWLVNGGSQNSNGEEWGPNASAFCSDINNVFTGAQFDSTYYLITENAFDEVLYENSALVAYYSGPLSMNIQHGQAIFGPQGAQPGPCTGSAIVPAPVPLTKATVGDYSTSAGSVDCRSIDLTPGTYNRVESHVRFLMNLSCTVEGNSAPYNAKRVGVWTKFDIVGTQNTSGYLKILSTSVAISGNGH